MNPKQKQRKKKRSEKGGGGGRRRRGKESSLSSKFHSKVRKNSNTHLELFAMGTEILRPQDFLARPIPSIRNRNPNPHPKPFKKRRERSPRPAKKSVAYVIGQVKILKRGEPIESNKKVMIHPDPKLFGPDRLGPDPDRVPTQIRIVPERIGDSYAGSAFSMSPSPRSLPLPRFWRRKEEGSAIPVDQSATKDLRRLLRLD